MTSLTLVEAHEIATDFNDDNPDELRGISLGLAKAESDPNARQRAKDGAAHLAADIYRELGDIPDADADKALILLTDALLDVAHERGVTDDDIQYLLDNQQGDTRRSVALEDPSGLGQDSGLHIVNVCDGVYVVHYAYDSNGPSFNRYDSLADAEEEFLGTLDYIIYGQTQVAEESENEDGYEEVRAELVYLWAQYTGLARPVCADLIDAGQFHTWARSADSTAIAKVLSEN